MAAASEHVSFLAQRIRAGLVVLAGTTLLFGVADALLQTSARPGLLAIKAGQALAIGLGLVWVLRGITVTERRLLVVGTAVASTLYLSSCWAAFLRDDLRTTSVLMMAGAITTSAFIPWGLWPQLVTAGVAAAGLLVCNVALGGVHPGDSYGILGAGTALGGSVIVAAEQERQRRTRERVSALLASQTRILELVATGTPLPDVLRALCSLIESQAPGILCSVLLLEGERLHHGAAPSLPLAYTTAIDGLVIGPEVGSCGSAAWHCKPIVVADIGRDARWANFATLAKSHDLQACWSVPILARDGTCLGTFAMYYREPRDPGAAEWELLETAAHLAGIAIARAHGETALAASRRRLEEESQVAGALVRVGQEMISTIDTSLVLARLCHFATELLDCEAADTLMRDADDVFRVASSHGYPPEISGLLRDVELPAAALAPLLHSIDGTNTVAQARADRVPPQIARIFEWLGVQRVLYVPLRRGQATVGLLAASRRQQRAPFTPVEERIALGLAHFATLALENARLVEELRTATRLKSEFVSTMSHELRTPLSVIIGYTEMLADLDVSPPERVELLNRVRRQSLELLSMIEATLDLGRLEAGRDQPQLEPIHIGVLFAELATDFTAMTPVPGPELCWEPPAADEFVTDPRKLRTVLKNLVGNALKFTPSGSIVVRCRPTDAECVFTVRDTGIGIPAAQLPVIWDMFRQVDGSDTRSYAGVGLGLYIVQRLVGQLGGTVHVESAVGRGTTFTVTLPRPNGPAVRAAG